MGSHDADCFESNVCATWMGICLFVSLGLRSDGEGVQCRRMCRERVSTPIPLFGPTCVVARQLLLSIYSMGDALGVAEHRLGSMMLPLSITLILWGMLVSFWNIVYA